MNTENQQPDLPFEYWTPDQVAECLPCSEQLYAFLWNELVPKMRKFDNIEDCGPSDVVGVNAVAEFWSDIPENFRAELNQLSRTHLE